MKNKLTIIKPAAINLPATTPPPRKEDIINAMVERARVKHEEERQKLTVQHQKAKKEFDDAVIEELKKNPDSFEITVNHWQTSAKVEYRIRVIPPHLTRLKRLLDAVPSVGSFNPQEVKRQIREGMSTAGDRVKALLENPTAVKALDAALNEMQKRA